MPEVSQYAPGTPTWVDVSVPDVPAAQQFYSSLFGWTAEEGDPEFGGYAMFTKDGKNVAGIGPIMAEGQPAVWSTYLATDDIDKTTELVTAAGGQVIAPPMAVGDAGKMALYVDAAGAFFGVWQAGTNTGAELLNEPGALCWNELSTRDVEAAKAFYAAAFPVSAEASEWDPTYTTLNVDGKAVAGLMPMPAAYPPQVPAHWAVYFAVADTDAVAAKAAELGGTVRMPAFDSPPGRTAVLADPAGAVFAVITLNPDFAG